MPFNPTQLRRVNALSPMAIVDWYNRLVRMHNPNNHRHLIDLVEFIERNRTISCANYPREAILEAIAHWKEVPYTHAEAKCRVFPRV